MPRAATQQPDVTQSRMALHDEVAVGRLLVLADPRLDQRSILHCRKTEREILANPFQCCLADYSLTIRRIERVTACIVGHFESAPVASGDAIEEAVAMVFR